MGGSSAAAKWISMAGALGSLLILSLIALSILIAASIVLRCVVQCACNVAFLCATSLETMVHLFCIMFTIVSCISIIPSVMLRLIFFCFFLSSLSVCSCLHCGITPIMSLSSVCHSSSFGVLLLSSLFIVVSDVVIALAHGHHWSIGVVSLSSYDILGMTLLISVMILISSLSRILLSIVGIALQPVSMWRRLGRCLHPAMHPSLIS